MADWTDEQIDAATRVFCAGLPLETHPEANSLAGLIAKGRCMAPNCDCWEGGRTVTRAALEAASKIDVSLNGKTERNVSDSASPGAK